MMHNDVFLFIIAPFLYILEVRYFQATGGSSTIYPFRP